MDFLDLRQDKDTNSKPKQDNEFVDQAIDLMTGMQETTKEEPGELMGDNKINNEIIDLTGKEENAGELMGGDDKIIDLTGKEEDTGELMGGDDNMMYFTL